MKPDNFDFEDDDSPRLGGGVWRGGLVLLVIFKLFVLLFRCSTAASRQPLSAEEMMARAQQTQQSQASTRIMMLGMNWRIYLATKGKPAQSLKELETLFSEGGTPSLGEELFTYKMIPQKIDSASQKPLGERAVTAAVAFTATPNTPELVALTGVAFNRKNQEEVLLICKANSPGAPPPAVPKPPAVAGAVIQCPTGSSEVITLGQPSHP